MYSFALFYIHKNKRFGPVVHDFTKWTALNRGQQKAATEKSFNPQMCLEKTAHTAPELEIHSIGSIPYKA